MTTATTKLPWWRKNEAGIRILGNSVVIGWFCCSSLPPGFCYVYNQVRTRNIYYYVTAIHFTSSGTKSIITMQLISWYAQVSCCCSVQPLLYISSPNKKLVEDVGRRAKQWRYRQQRHSTNTTLLYILTFTRLCGWWGEAVGLNQPRLLLTPWQNRAHIAIHGSSSCLLIDPAARAGWCVWLYQMSKSSTSLNSRIRRWALACLRSTKICYVTMPADGSAMQNLLHSVFSSTLGESPVEITVIGCPKLVPYRLAARWSLPNRILE